jgi:hypothetical protein
MAFDRQTATKTWQDREAGRALPGFVGLRNFDEGVVRTLGAEVMRADESGHRNYFIATEKIGPVQPAPGLPGIPITFSHPEDIWARYKQPVIVIRRDDIAPAMNRWHPGMTTARYPSTGANPLQTSYGNGPDAPVLSGYDSYDTKQQAVPFDITYTISILARYRGRGPDLRRNVPEGFDGAPGSPRTQCNSILDYILRIYAPYSQVTVLDSLGDPRLYSTFMEAISHLDEVPEVTERVLGFALTLRVEAELDLKDPETRRAASQPLTVRTEVL